LISRLRGTIVSRSEAGVEVATSGGVVYEVEVPLTVAERLPRVGEPVELRTVQVVREDRVGLYGFLDADERRLFQTVLGATGIGAKVAVAMLSTYSASRLARVLAEKDIAALVQIPNVGKKTAERIALELADKVKNLGLHEGVLSEAEGGAREAVQALVALGMSFSEADQAVRAAMGDDAEVETDELVRRALAAR
jgi:holliday junction DNA helicase RuvA